MICSPLLAGRQLNSSDITTPILGCRSAFDFTPVGDYAVRFAVTYGWVNADVLHAVPYAGDKRKIGLLLKLLDDVGFLRPLRYLQSRREKCHNRPIMLYGLKRGGAA